MQDNTPDGQPASAGASATAAVVLVHGTFAAADSDVPTDHDRRFWQCDSAFCRGLQAALGDRFTVGTMGTGSIVFHWSGDNSEAARRAAGAHLLRHLCKLEEANVDYHIIAHSHGGGVLWEALCRGRTKLTHLKSWTTVGTPFLHFIPDLVPLASGLLALAGIIGVFTWQYKWLRDFWENALLSVPYAPWQKMLSVAILHTLALLCLTASIHIGYRFFAADRAQCDPRPTSAVPDTEMRYTCASALFLFVLLGTAFGIQMCSPILAHAMLLALPNATLLVPSLYFLTATLLGLLFFAAAVAPALQVLGCLYRRRCSRKAWGQFASIYSCITCPDTDEALNALTQIVAGIRGPLLPRVKVSGADRYTAVAGWVRQPERRAVGIIAYCALVLTIIRDWAFRPLYNEVFAELVDAFVLRKLSRQAHGSDCLGLRLGRVSIGPILRPEDLPRPGGRVRDVLVRLFAAIRREGETDPARRWCGPDRTTCDALCDATAESGARLLAQIRRGLGFRPEAAASLPEFLARAMGGDVSAMELFVHTRYFENERVGNLIASRLENPLSECAGLPVSAEGTQPSCPPGIYPPVGFRWWLAQRAVLLLVLATPSLLLALYGWVLLRPMSRDASIAWACRPLPVVAVTAQSIGQVNSGGIENMTPRFVRWWAAVKILKRNEDAAFADAMSSFIDDPIKMAVVEATVAQKMIAMGDVDGGVALLEKVERTVKSRDWADAVKKQLWPIRKALNLSIPFDRAGRLGELSAIKSITFVPEERASDNRRQEIRDLWAIEESIRRSKEPMVSAAGYSAVDEPGVVEKIAKLLESAEDADVDQMFQILQPLLAAEAELLVCGRAEEADVVLDAALNYGDGVFRRLETSMEIEEWVSARVIVTVLLAKSFRYPESRRLNGLKLLRAAERTVQRLQQPLLRAKLSAHVAGAYARLGFFGDAQRLSITADPDDTIMVALQILANELETRSSAGGALWPKAEMNLRIRQAIDEQLDPLRFNTPLL